MNPHNFLRSGRPHLFPQLACQPEHINPKGERDFTRQIQQCPGKCLRKALEIHNFSSSLLKKQWWPHVLIPEGCCWTLLVATKPFRSTNEDR